MEKKIRRITATRNEKEITWSADNLHWDDLPKSLLRDIEMEYPKYLIEIEYYN